MPDHVHGLLQLTADVAIAEAIRTVKSNSSRWIHRTFPTMRAFAWQNGYGAFTVSESEKAKVIDYIARQPEHHAKRDFRSEFLALIKKHGITVDERWLWD